MMPKTTDSTTKTAHSPNASRAVITRLDYNRESLEYGPASIATALRLAYLLLHECDMATSEPSPLATQANIAALVDCARMSADLLRNRLDSVYEAFDGTGGQS